MIFEHNGIEYDTEKAVYVAGFIYTNSNSWSYMKKGEGELAYYCRPKCKKGYISKIYFSIQNGINSISGFEVAPIKPAFATLNTENCCIGRSVREAFSLAGYAKGVTK